MTRAKKAKKEEDDSDEDPMPAMRKADPDLDREMKMMERAMAADEGAEAAKTGFDAAQIKLEQVSSEEKKVSAQKAHQTGDVEASKAVHDKKMVNVVGFDHTV